MYHFANKVIQPGTRFILHTGKRKNFNNSIINFEVRNCATQNVNTVAKKRSWFSFRSVITRWTPLSAVTYCGWLYVNGINEDISKIEIGCYRNLPLRIVSKIWGKIANIELPESTRPYIYNKYATAFGVNMSEAISEDFTTYQSLGAFFTRELKTDARIVEKKACIVSPCDGKILTCGPAFTDRIEQVKGVTYSLENFFGNITWKTTPKDVEYYNQILKNPNNILHQCVIYLAPGDYHRFHSPAEWTAVFRRHFSGKLLSVNPIFAKLIPGLFCLNERAVYVGDWKHGFFSFTAVGATNVGSISVYKDVHLHTNGRRQKNCDEVLLSKDFKLDKGELVGQFNMGSTIVLIFEAPKDFSFNFKQGDVVKMGQELGAFGDDKLKKSAAVSNK